MQNAEGEVHSGKQSLPVGCHFSNRPPVAALQ